MNPLRDENPALRSWRSHAAPSREAASRLRVAVVGLGKQGGKLARAALDGGFQLVAVCDSNEARLLSFEGSAVMRVTRIEALPARDIDICILATLADSHVPLLKQLHAIGIPAVLCEKPVVNNLPDLEKIRELLAGGNMRLLVNHSKLWSVDLAFGRELIQQNGLGDLKHIEVRFKSQGFGNIGSHMIASVLYLTGRAIRSVRRAAFQEHAGVSRQKGAIDPNGFALFDLDGVPFSIDNRSLPVSPPGRLTFTFEKGLIELNDEANILRCVHFETGDDQEQLFRNPWFGSRSSWDVMVEWLSRALLELAGGGDPHKMKVALSAVEAILAAHECHRSRRAVELPLVPGTVSSYSFS